MVCPRCHSYNVATQIVTDTRLKTAHHGLLWWLIVGWWWVPIKWVLFFLPALIVKIFAPKKYRLKQRHRGMCACQDCGYTWRA